MKITFLGTSSGKASLNRYHSALLFTSEKYNLLVDAGDGISRALMSNGITLQLFEWNSFHSSSSRSLFRIAGIDCSNEDNE
ncbi:MAG: hypothetical protein U5J96_03575 [Ignavibacteriaceae bacterium]|nr:hypothetical protein [Ignavibacteriaceae bacterium]